MSLSHLFASYKTLWKSIIKPPRQEYTPYSLGPPEFTVNGHLIERIEPTITNKRGFNLVCSYFHHAKISTPLPCVIYLHGNGCCQTEALQYKEAVLACGFNFFCFDFTACGKSEGKYSSLGIHEQEDLEQVITYLKSTHKVEKIAFWGRSMGAVTALLYTLKNPIASCLVLDSAFADFQRVYEEQAKKRTSIPSFITSGAFKMLRMTIKKKAQFSIDDLKPIKDVKSLHVPALFGAAEEDALIFPSHTKELHEEYGGSKRIFLFPGTHNVTRPAEWVSEATNYLKTYLPNILNSGAYLRNHLNLSGTNYAYNNKGGYYPENKVPLSPRNASNYSNNSSRAGSIYSKDAPSVYSSDAENLDNKDFTKTRSYRSGSLNIPPAYQNQKLQNGDQAPVELKAPAYQYQSRHSLPSGSAINVKFIGGTPSQYYMNAGNHLSRFATAGNQSKDQDMSKDSDSFAMNTSKDYSKDYSREQDNSYQKTGQENKYVNLSRDVYVKPSYEQPYQAGPSSYNRGTTYRIDVNSLAGLGTKVPSLGDIDTQKQQHRKNNSVDFTNLSFGSNKPYEQGNSDGKSKFSKLESIVTGLNNNNQKYIPNNYS